MEVTLCVVVRGPESDIDLLSIRIQESKIAGEAGISMYKYLCLFVVNSWTGLERTLQGNHVYYKDRYKIVIYSKQTQENENSDPISDNARK